MTSSLLLRDKPYYFGRWDAIDLQNYLKNAGDFCIVKRGTVIRGPTDLLKRKFYSSPSGFQLQGFDLTCKDITTIVEELIVKTAKVENVPLKPVSRPSYVIVDECLTDQETPNLSGAFGKVVKSLYSKDSRQQPVLVARKYGSNKEGRALLFREVLLIAKLPSHQNVVQVLGITIFKEVSLIMEWCEALSLDKFLAKNDVSNSQKLIWSKQCAQGIIHLNHNGIAHRDVHIFNLLLQKNVLKIGDFGRCTQIDETNSYIDAMQFGKNVLRRLFISKSGGKTSFSSQSESPEDDGKIAPIIVNPELEIIQEIVNLCSGNRANIPTIDVILDRLNSIQNLS